MLIKTKAVRHRVISFRCSPEEYERLKIRAIELNYRSLTDLARAGALSHAGIAVDLVSLERRLEAVAREVKALSLAAGRRVEL